MPSPAVQVGDYAASASTHAQRPLSQSQSSHTHASPPQFVQTQSAAACLAGCAQQDVLGVTAADAVVAQPHAVHKHVSQLQSPEQSGHLQSMQPQLDAAVVDRLEVAKPKVPAHAKVAAARTAGIEKVVMISRSMRMEMLKQNLERTIGRQIISAICKEEREGMDRSPQ